MSQQLKKLRKQIDEVDEEILKLLERRAKLAEDVGIIKQDQAKKSNSPMTYYVPERERQILSRLEKMGGEFFPKESIKSVFREIISACRSLQKPMQISFLGPQGTYSHLAAQKTFGISVNLQECTTIEDVFDSVERKEALFGIVPIENSTEGGVQATLDRLLTTSLKIHSEVVVDISHCLIGKISDLNQIRRVYSHSQALSQCSSWLAQNLPMAQQIATNSTMEAANTAKTDPGGVAIASHLAAELTSLPIIKEKIQDQVNNATRFIALHSMDAEPSGNDKTSLIFSTGDGAGALAEILQLFHNEKINLTRIESRASRDKMWQYVFFTELEGHSREEPLNSVLKKLQSLCSLVKVLGSYPKNN